MKELKLQYFELGRIENGYGRKGIILPDRVFSISRIDDVIVFTEECDGYFSGEYTKEEAIEVLQEAIAWIKLQ